MTLVKKSGIIVAVMPNTLRRALLVLLLAVAVPLQGYAAVSIGVCRGLAHHGDAAVPSEQHAHHGDRHAGENRAPHGSHEGESTEKSHHCAACASCGVAAAISAAPVVYVSDSPHQGIVAADFPAPEGYVPEGLDRPPLSLLV